MNKKGVMGEGIIMIYRLLLVSFIAFIILGISSVFYAHYIDVRDAEARVLARNVVECVSPNGILNLDALSEEEMKNILSYCGFNDGQTERFYVKLNVKDVAKLSQGDSGALWVLEIFNNDRISEGLKKYKPGYYEFDYPVYVIKEGNKFESEISGRILISNEF